MRHNGRHSDMSVSLPHSPSCHHVQCTCSLGAWSDNVHVSVVQFKCSLSAVSHNLHVIHVQFQCSFGAVSHKVHFIMCLCALASVLSVSTNRDHTHDSSVLHVRNWPGTSFDITRDPNKCVSHCETYHLRTVSAMCGNMFLFASEYLRHI